MDLPPTQGRQFFHVIQDQITIMFVDDDPILREFATVHLSSDQASVFTAKDGLDALEKLARSKPDLILLDLEMPNMNGFEFLRHLHETQLLPDVPIIVATGREDVAAIDRAYQAGATSFVVKPLNWRQLAYQIRYVHRTFLNERALRQAADLAQAQATAAQTQLAALAQRSFEFATSAMRLQPGLKPLAVDYARDISDALSAGGALRAGG